MSDKNENKTFRKGKNELDEEYEKLKKLKK
jgi:hypothetical protein